jgi:hypothetical protein
MTETRASTLLLMLMAIIILLMIAIAGLFENEPVAGSGLGRIER